MSRCTTNYNFNSPSPVRAALKRRKPSAKTTKLSRPRITREERSGKHWEHYNRGEEPRPGTEDRARSVHCQGRGRVRVLFHTAEYGVLLTGEHRTSPTPSPQP